MIHNPVSQFTELLPRFIMERPSYLSCPVVTKVVIDSSLYVVNGASAFLELTALAQLVVLGHRQLCHQPKVREVP